MSELTQHRWSRSLRAAVLSPSAHAAHIPEWVTRLSHPLPVCQRLPQLHHPVGCHHRHRHAEGKLAREPRQTRFAMNQQQLALSFLSRNARCQRFERRTPRPDSRRTAMIGRHQDLKAIDRRLGFDQKRPPNDSAKVQWIAPQLSARHIFRSCQLVLLNHSRSTLLPSAADSVAMTLTPPSALLICGPALAQFRDPQCDRPAPTIVTVRLLIHGSG